MRHVPGRRRSADRMVRTGSCPAHQGPPDGISQGCGEAERGDNASAFDHLGLAIMTTQAASLRCAPPWLSSPFCSIGSTATSVIIAGFALSDPPR